MQASQIERWTLIATILASTMAFIDSTALSIVQLDLQSEFNAAYNLVAWVINGYGLFLAALILVGGALGDLYGRKRVFTVGIIVFTAASLACGLAPSIEVLIAARIAQGIGGALMTPGSLALISAVFPAERRGGAIGLWSMFSSLMVIVGPVLGGQFAAWDFWRGVFFINIPLALISLYGLRFVPESRDPNARRLDIPGALLATLGLAGLTYGFTEAPAQGFGAPLVLLALVGGAAALVAFVLVERAASEPMIPLRLFQSRTFSGANLLTLFLYGALGAVSVFLPPNLLRAQAYEPQIASLALLPLAVALTLMSRFMGGLVGRVGARPMLIVGPAVAGVGFFILGIPGVTGGAGEYWTTFFPGALALGVGMGITVAPLTTAVMNSAPSHSAGVASGINNAVARTASVLAIAIFSAAAVGMFSSALAANLPDELSAEARTAFELEAAKLADARVPASVPADLQTTSDLAIRESFAATFRVVAWGSAALAWLSALAAFALVEGKRPRPT